MTAKSTQTPNLLWHLGSPVQPALKHSKVWLKRVAAHVHHSSCCHIWQMMIATAKSEQDAQAGADLFLTPSPAARSDFEVWGMSGCLFFLTIYSRNILSSWGAAPMLQRWFQDRRSQFWFVFPSLSIHSYFFAWLLFFCQRKLVHHSPAMRQ